MAKDEVIRRAWEVIEPHLAEQDYELVEIEFGQHGANWILRLFVDREGGITIDDCTAVSQLMGPILDGSDFIGGSYMLEVSSPGIDRPVRKAADF
ncbi:MAG: ribosome maturation factor RimP, partial [bacterium]|nr:ribosome maturation factor RimP [bacterium]